MTSVRDAKLEAALIPVLGAVTSRVVLRATRILLERRGQTLDSVSESECFETIQGCARSMVSAPEKASRFRAALEKALGLDGQPSPERNRTVPEHMPSRVAAGSSLSSLRRTARQPSVSEAPSAPQSRLLQQVSREEDVTALRQKCKAMAAHIGFSYLEQVRLTTAVSELARNILQYVGEGQMSIRMLQGHRQGLEIIAMDEGPGIHNLDVILSGNYRSKTGMGKGITGVRALMHDFEIDSGSWGTRVCARRYIGNQ